MSKEITLLTLKYQIIKKKRAALPVQRESLCIQGGNPAWGLTESNHLYQNSLFKDD
jgi:hypothetical protein